MSELPRFLKYINVLDEKGRPLRERKTGKLVSRLVEMTDEEVAQHIAETQANQEEA